MERSELSGFRERKKKQTLALMEVDKLTRELADAVERGDQVSMELIINMRRDPLRELQEIEEDVRRRLLELPPEDAARMDELLGGAEPDSEAERPLAEQVGRYRRLLKSVSDMDETISVRMGGKRSFYKKFRRA